MSTTLIEAAALALVALATCNSNDGDDPWFDRQKVNSARDALLRATQATPEGCGSFWQPIDTAPRDGTEVILWVWGRRIIGAWLPYRDPSYPELWQDQDGCAIIRPWKDDEEPILWAPLPEEPNV